MLVIVGGAVIHLLYDRLVDFIFSDYRLSDTSSPLPVYGVFCINRI